MARENSTKKAKTEVLTIKRTRKTVMARDMMIKIMEVNHGLTKKMIGKKNIENLIRKNNF